MLHSCHVIACTCVHAWSLLCRVTARFLFTCQSSIGGSGLLPRSLLFCVQQWMLLPISAKCMVWSHWYLFGIRLLLTNPSPQLLITQTCKVVCWLSCAIKVHDWNTFSRVIPASPAYSQHPQRIDPSKSPGIFQLFWRNCLYLRVTPLSLDSPSALHSCTLQYILVTGLEEIHTLECHFENLTHCKFFILLMVWSQRLA